jgi:uncharacterized membrane protein
MEEEFTISLIVGFIFFIFKLITIRLKKNIDNDQKSNLQRESFRDGILVIVIMCSVLYIKNEFFSKKNVKTRVFTNEPGF